MSGPFPFPTRYLDEVVAPGSVHPTEFYSTTDPALDANNHVTAGKRWRKVDNLTTPTWYEIYIRNQANDAWITEGKWVLAEYAPGQVPAADADGRLAPADIEGGESGGGGGPATIDIEDEGAAEGAADTIDFVGSGVSVTFAAGQATVTIPGGAAGPGALVELDEQTTVGGESEIDFEGFIDDTYQEYVVTVRGVIPGTDNSDLYCRLSKDGGTNYLQGTEYAWASDLHYSNTFSTDQQHDGDSKVIVAHQLGSDTGEAMDVDLRFHNLRDATKYKRFRYRSTGFCSVPAAVETDGTGVVKDAAAFNAIRFYPSTGTFAAGGVFRLFGVVP